MNRHLSSNQRLTVALSGGRDSVALLHVANELRTVLDFHLTACHVNHRLSPNADEWQAFCQIFCNKLDVPLDVIVVDVPRSSAEGPEAAARTQRYAAFARIAADWLLLGQHRGDQAETMLFNLLRGAGLLGASGMPETRRLGPELRLLRPLLAVDRADIEAYLRKHGLSWVEDESNANIAFTRNFMRHQVMPLLQSRFPAAEATLAAGADRFAEAGMLLDELALLDLEGLPAHFPLPLASLAKLPEARGRNVLRLLLTRHGVRIPREQRLIEALRQLLEAGSDRHPKIVFGDWKLIRRRDSVYLDPCQSGD